jgi:hypothetical protein
VVFIDSPIVSALFDLVCIVYHVFIVGLLSYLEDRGNRFLQSAGAYLSIHMMLHPVSVNVLCSPCDVIPAILLHVTNCTE